MYWLEITTEGTTHLVNLAHVVSLSVTGSEHSLLMADGTMLGLTQEDADRVRSLIGRTTR